jgi:thiamine-monophosphate kinase
VRLSDIGELKLLDEIKSRFSKRSRSVLTGIGDDAAVLSFGKGKILATTDFMFEDVHFDLKLVTPYQLGFKLISVNVSDIYAMGGRPRFVLLGMAAPAGTKETFINRLLDGVAQALKTYEVSLVGGDISSGRKMVLSATLLGSAEKAVTRSGAKVGDKIYVTGTLGDSACGLGLLKRIWRPVDLNRPLNKPIKWSIMRPLLRRHLMPEARRPGTFIRRATSMIDLSDGLLIDLARLCSESGVGARIYENKIPISNQMRKAADFLGFDALSFALKGGEDYELLFTAPALRRVDASCIGEVTEKGMVMVDSFDQERPVRADGYRHFG